MASDSAEKPIKTKGLTKWHIIGGVLGIGFLLWVISRIEFNKNFWILLGVISGLVIMWLIMGNLKNKEQIKSGEEIIRLIQFHNKKLPHGFLLDHSVDNTKVEEISSGVYVAHFINEGLTFIVRNDIVTGWDYTTLYDKRDQIEKSNYFKEIMKTQSKRDSLLEYARMRGIPLPEDE